jgi:hypothetical protein
VQGRQSFTLFVTEDAGADAPAEVATGQAYPTLLPEEAAALAGALNQAFAQALAPAAGQEAPGFQDLRIEVGEGFLMGAWFRIRRV